MFEKFFNKPPKSLESLESSKIDKKAELDLRGKTIAELKKREEARHDDADAKEISKTTDEERRKNSNEFAAIHNLIKQLEGTEEVIETGGILSKEKVEKVEGKTIPSLIQEIEGFIAKDQEEVDKIKESGKQPSPRLINGMEIQKYKRELLREIAGL